MQKTVLAVTNEIMGILVKNSVTVYIYINGSIHQTKNT